MNATPTATGSLCTFFLDGLLFGIEAHRVQEVFSARALTPVPLGPVAVRGLVNLRGQILVAIDMHVRMGLPQNADAAPPMNLVVKTEDGPVSLLVDKLGDVLDVSDTAFETPPETLGEAERELVVGVYKLQGHLLHLLNVDNVLATGRAV